VSEITLRVTLNRVPMELRAEAGKSLLRILREDLGMTSVKEGCGQGDCGACVIVLDGEAVNSCLVLAAQADGAEIITLEGLALQGVLHPLQRAFSEMWAFQCGFCAPGMLMSAYALLLHTPSPTRDEIEEAIEGNLCRCTSYRAVIEAIDAAASELRREGLAAGAPDA